ncbi:chaperone protein dnaJ 1, mitochondrial isoform X2 [Elaeis guineensis]|uniref:Chaperone protein dnaJ 1, mitochondrial isoform X2 n=1 Tax=Elaeis guineensis var. tenera TaxID=51953 RepID=A0A6I9S9P4_ELAGV|nr:chaperone protein dnaJ 1, mitochondrial isoform X2 [Elaeis guineensis]
MGRIGWLGFSPRSFLLRFRRSCGNSPITGVRLDLLRGRTEEALPFLRSFSHLSLLYKYNLDIVERPHNIYRSSASSLNRSFHATALRYATDRDYYEILGVPKDATREDIKKAFHALAKKYHPDANKNNPAAKRKFQEIRDAYETLRDPEKRAQYDREFSEGAEKVRYAGDDASGCRSTYEDPFSGFYRANQDPFSDTFYKIFSEVFENERDIYAADIQVELNLSFSEAARGCKKQVSFSAQVPCDSCYGRGHSVNAKPIKCPTCNGVGRVTVFPFTSTCRSCKGLGKIIKDYCLVCKGSGVVDGVKNVNVTIPAGVDCGDTIHVPRAGNQGGHGAQPGNLYIKMQVAKDPVFLRDGADIYVDAQIRFTQAILGGKIEVPTLFGKTHVKIPEGVQPGQLLVLRGRGLPKQVGLVDHGDQYVRFRVNFPSSVNERQRELLEEFAKEEAIQESSGSAEGNWLYEKLSTG